MLHLLSNGVSNSRFMLERWVADDLRGLSIETVNITTTDTLSPCGRSCPSGVRLWDISTHWNGKPPSQDAPRIHKLLNKSTDDLIRHGRCSCFLSRLKLQHGFVQQLIKVGSVLVEWLASGVWNWPYDTTVIKMS